MTLLEVRDILRAQVLYGEDKLDREVMSACGSDFMSDVLAYVKNQALLLTGLVNPQVVRTADMMDMKCICFVRGKTPDESVLALARERDIVVMCSPLRMYDACGKLYTSGLQGDCT
jgi:predicted transcriptional regulator